MQLDENTANSVAVRPTAEAAGAVRWFRERDLGGGITGTTMDADYLNDLLGVMIAVLAAGSITRTKGASGDDDLLDAIKAIIGINRPQSTLDGYLKRTAAGIIQLQPLVGNDVACAIDDTVLRNTGAISFNMAADLEGSEAASTAYYFYLRNDAGSLDAQISATAPDLPGGTKPGFKNGDATRRCVGSMWNDDNQDFPLCTWQPGGVVLLHAHGDDHEHVPASSGPAWADQALNIPLCALAVHVTARLSTASGGTTSIGASDAATNPDGSKLGANGHENLAGVKTAVGQQLYQDTNAVLPIEDPAVPAISWEGDELDELAVIGWVDLFAPR